MYIINFANHVEPLLKEQKHTLESLFKELEKIERLEEKFYWEELPKIGIVEDNVEVIGVDGSDFEEKFSGIYMVALSAVGISKNLSLQWFHLGSLKPYKYTEERIRQRRDLLEYKIATLLSEYVLAKYEKNRELAKYEKDREYVILMDGELKGPLLRPPYYISAYKPEKFQLTSEIARLFLEEFLNELENYYEKLKGEAFEKLERLEKGEIGGIENLQLGFAPSLVDEIETIKISQDISKSLAESSKINREEISKELKFFLEHVEFMFFYGKLLENVERSKGKLMLGAVVKDSNMDYLKRRLDLDKEIFEGVSDIPLIELILLREGKKFPSGFFAFRYDADSIAGSDIRKHYISGTERILRNNSSINKFLEVTENIGVHIKPAYIRFLDGAPIYLLELYAPTKEAVEEEDLKKIVKDGYDRGYPASLILAHNYTTIGRKEMREVIAGVKQLLISEDERFWAFVRDGREPLIKKLPA